MDMSGPSGPGRKGESVFILGPFLLSSQVLISPPQPFLKIGSSLMQILGSCGVLGTQLIRTFILRVCFWGRFCLLLDGKESRVVDPLRQPERRREAGLDALGGEPTLALIPDFLSDVECDLIHPHAGLLPVLRGAHLARDELLQHTHGGILRFLTRGPLNDQGDPHGYVYLLREALVGEIIQALRILADNLDVRAY